ncbi:hypothetical protein ACQPZA_26075 [Pseudonocardia xinjiangensis]|uniref:hypothetical protein n=1 Tax=Pseudonocardia xinjiangensis TaxID=75289 RepID=UPI003D9282CD
MAARSRLTAADVGAWLFTCNPREFAELELGLRNGRSVDGWCAHPTYRVDLVEADQAAVLWVSGNATSVPEPGIWMVGRTTGVITRGEPRPRVGLAMTLLPEVLPREQLRADPRTAGLEVLRAPQMSNPSIVSPEEKAVIEELIGGWP